MPSKVKGGYTVSAQYGYASGQSKDGLYVAYLGNGSPYLYVYYWNGSTYTACTLSAPMSQAFVGQNASVKFSPNGNYLVISSGGNYAEVYKKTATTTFTRVGTTTALPVNKTCWDDDSILIAGTGQSASPALYIAQRSGDTFSPLTLPSGITEIVYQVAIKNGIIYAVGGTKVFKLSVSGSTVTFVNSWLHGITSAYITSGTFGNCAISNDGKSMYISQNGSTTAGSNSPILKVFDTVAETFNDIYIDVYDPDLPLTLNSDYIGSYHCFSPIGDNSMLATYWSIGNSYSFSSIFTTNGGAITELMRFNARSSGYAMNGGDMVTASDTAIVKVNGGGDTTIWRTPLGAYLPRVKSTYINTGL
jgi:hypothetical protein